MRQQQTFRGFIFILLMLILLVTAMKFPYGGQAEKLTSQEFIRMLDEGQVAEAEIGPNAQTPTGEVKITLKNGDVIRQNFSDIREAEKLLTDRNIDYTCLLYTSPSPRDTR